MAESTLLDAHTNTKKISGNSVSGNAVNRKICDLNDKLSNADDFFFWNGDIEDLKRFVAESLQLVGKWTSPGGDTKQFSNENVTLKWSGASKKKLSIVKDVDSTLEKLLSNVIKDKSSVKDTKPLIILIKHVGTDKDNTCVKCQSEDSEISTIKAK